MTCRSSGFDRPELRHELDNIIRKTPIHLAKLVPLDSLRQIIDKVRQVLDTPFAEKQICLQTTIVSCIKWLALTHHFSLQMFGDPRPQTVGDLRVEPSCDQRGCTVEAPSSLELLLDELNQLSRDDRAWRTGIDNGLSGQASSMQFSAFL